MLITKMNLKLNILNIICIAQMLECAAQQNHINLKQGTIVGLKVFPDSARAAVYAFLGIPYAQPPIGELRFSHPKPHIGWNWTLQATNMKPVCPQLSNTIYDETVDDLPTRSVEMSEDCLYLNVWVSENGLRYGNLPVLIVLTGEDMSYDWSRNRVTGLDMAADGFVVVTVQYRLNIFGWINVRENSDLNGNYGIHDQTLALEWIQENIKSFGGNPKLITLLGHGTGGAPSAFLHFLRQQMSVHNAEPLFQQMILMSSGNIEKSLASVDSVQAASKVVVQKLGCHFEENGRQVLSCLRSKSISDLLKAFETIYDHGNGTHHLGPSVAFNLAKVLANSSIMDDLPNTLVGITSNEGAFLQDIWLELAREGYESLRSYVNFTLLRNFASVPGLLNGNRLTSLEALNWRYFSSDFEADRLQLLASLQRFLSEYEYEIPFYRFLNQISNTTFSNQKRVYAYMYDFTNTMDMRGKINLVGGASHTSDLPLLFGPTLFQQIARRRFTVDEEKMYRKIRTPFANFIKNGNPNVGRTNEAWQPFTKHNNVIYNLGDKWTVTQIDQAQLDAKNIQKLEQFFDKEKSIPSRTRANRNQFNNQYQMPNDKRDIPASVTSHSVIRQSSDYAVHLRRVHGYWQVFLPQTFTTPNGHFTDDSVTQRLLYMEASADAARYKHGFFIMLFLVLVLLVLLCLCIYLLKRDPLAPSPNLNCDL